MTSISELRRQAEVAGEQAGERGDCEEGHFWWLAHSVALVGAAVVERLDRANELQEAHTALLGRVHDETMTARLEERVENARMEVERMRVIGGACDDLERATTTTPPEEREPESAELPAIGSFKAISSAGDELEIDPFHDGGHVVLAVKTFDLLEPGEALRPTPRALPGYADIDLSPADLWALHAWIDLHFEALPACSECGGSMGETGHGDHCSRKD